MAIWRLRPLNVDFPDWEISTYKGEVIVRAQDEEEARMRASGEFITSTDIKVGEKKTRDPWIQQDVVSCELLTGSQYPEHGESKVLFPVDT